MEAAATCSRIRRERRPSPAESHSHALTMLSPLLASLAPGQPLTGPPPAHNY
jgi:hypothetical protein